MPYRFKVSGPYCEFIVRERGPAGSDYLSIELDSTYDAGFVEALKRTLRHGEERTWDADNKRWYISPGSLDKAVDVAKQYFSNVFKTDGEEVIDLQTGDLIPQTGSLFG